MELIPSSETDSCTATHELLSMLWNPVVHYYAQKARHCSLS
jgi:hypothetical protein